MSSIGVHIPTFLDSLALRRASWTDANQPTALRPDPQAGELFSMSAFESTANIKLQASHDSTFESLRDLQLEAAARRNPELKPELKPEMARPRNAGEQTAVICVRDLDGNVISVRRERFLVSG